MSRVINTNAPNKIRNHNRRLIAEMMLRMGKKQEIDAETKDMAATIVFALRELYELAEETAKAWEKRDYWIKAERFINDWRWAVPMAANWEDVIREEAWDLLPDLMMEIFPRFTDIEIKTFTKKPVEWNGKLKKLLAQEPNVLPY